MTDSQEVAGDLFEKPIRPLLLALLGLVTGLAIHVLLGSGAIYEPLTAGTLSLLVALTVTAGLIGFTIEFRRWWASIAFAVGTGVVAGAVMWWNGNPNDWSASEGWRAVSLFLAIAVAAPLFQAARDEGRARFPYASVHDHAWTNVVLWFACWAFVAVVFALAYLLAELFHLIKLDFLRDLLRENWFGRVLLGTAFGGALGVLREHAGVVHLLQRVVAMVLSVLAPVLAAGLILFLVALPFTGLAPLWAAGSATAILLACIVGSLILANAVIGNASDQERRFPLLRYGAMGLAAAMLPLAILASIAIALRIGQYGFTPERLWALTFVLLACAYGAVYLVSLLRGRDGWAEKVRPANLAMAFVVCGVALLLATPLVSFNAISTRDQVARLESGRLSPEKFDWRALAWEFGDPGRAALKRLQASTNAAIRDRAAQAGRSKNRWDINEATPSPADVTKRVRVLPAGSPALPGPLLDYLARERCGVGQTSGCTVLWVDSATVLLLRDDCFSAGRGPCTFANKVTLADGEWSEEWERPRTVRPDDAKARAAAQQKAYAAGQVEIRKVERRQAFVGGVPVGEVFE